MRVTGRGCRSPSKPTTRRPRCTKNRAKSSSSSTLAASARTGRRQGAEGRDAPGRLPGGGLARDLLRLRRLRRERPARLRPRLRQHHRAAARTEAGTGADAERGDQHRAIRLDLLLRPLGRTRKRLQQRADRAADEDRLARTVRLDGEAADHQPAPARRHDRRAAGDEGVLRRRRRRLRTDQPRCRIAGRRGGDGDRARRPPDPLRRLHQVAAGGNRQPAPAPRLRPDPARRAPVLRPPLEGALTGGAGGAGADRGDQPAGRAALGIVAAARATPASTSPGPTCSNSSSGRSPRPSSRRSRSSSPAKR